MLAVVLAAFNRRADPEQQARADEQQHERRPHAWQMRPHGGTSLFRGRLRNDADTGAPERGRTTPASGRADRVAGSRARAPGSAAGPAAATATRRGPRSIGRLAVARVGGRFARQRAKAGERSARRGGRTAAAAANRSGSAVRAPRGTGSLPSAAAARLIPVARR